MILVTIQTAESIRRIKECNVCLCDVTCQCWPSYEFYFQIKFLTHLKENLSMKIS